MLQETILGLLNRIHREKEAVLKGLEVLLMEMACSAHVHRHWNQLTV